MVNAMLCVTCIWKLCKQQTHINGSTHSYCRTKALKMYQTKRPESDVTQESLLQQCTLDSQRAIKGSQERRKCEGERKGI